MISKPSEPLFLLVNFSWTVSWQISLVKVWPLGRVSGIFWLKSWQSNGPQLWIKLSHSNYSTWVKGHSYFSNFEDYGWYFKISGLTVGQINQQLNMQSAENVSPFIGLPEHINAFWNSELWSLLPMSMHILVWVGMWACPPIGGPRAWWGGAQWAKIKVHSTLIR